MATTTPMQLGMVGLGRMGANLARRAMRDGHTMVVTDVNPAAVDQLEGEGAIGAASLDALVASLAPPRAVWVMVPAGAITERAVADLADRLAPGDVIIDGGNTHYHDDIRRAAELAARGIEYMDVGTSGGVFGLERGFCLMIGGPDATFARLEPIFASLAPGFDAAERTPGRDGDPGREEQGYLHCGPAGSGHFVKMVHNGIEYGMMAAMAEGLNILHGADAGLALARRRRRDGAARPPRALPVRDRRAGRDRALAARQRRRLLAPRPHRDRAARVARRSTSSPAGSPTRARAAGPRSRRSRRACPPRCSPRRSTRASPRGARISTRTRCCRRCGSSSADTTRRSKGSPRG